MKKVLILAYDFPPYVSVGGLRPHSWYKYFHEFGIYPIVVTRQWNNKFGSQLDYISSSESAVTITEITESGTIIKTPYLSNFSNKLMLKYGSSKYKFFRKIISIYYEITQFLFHTGPKANLYYAAKEYLSKNKVDLILATGDPFVLFKYASELSKKFNTPWMADYRDTWSQNLSSQNNFLLNKWNNYNESKYVTTANSIVTVSEFLKIKISELIKNKNFTILPNGYDPEAIDKLNGINQKSEILNIAFVGSLYDYHPFKNFLSEVANFIQNNKNARLKINFYGINLYGSTFGTDLYEFISKEFPVLTDYIEIHKKTPYEKLLIELAEQNIMLLFNAYSYIGTKIFDYIGIKRKILLCYSNDAEALELKRKYFDIVESDEASNHLQEDLINETNSGHVIRDAKHLGTTLIQLYDEFCRTGQIECKTINSENYSRKHQVKQLAEIIKNISSTKNSKSN